MKKLRILINSNAPFATSGYSMQVADFTPRMKKEGYEVAVVCFYGLDGGEVDWNGIKLLPKVDDQWGTDAVLYHSHDFKPDVTFSLQDIWVMNDQNLKQFTRWIPIVPIDHEPTPPAIREKLKLAYRIVTYSQFGHRQLQKEGFHSTYIPHTVNTDIFIPLDKSECRRVLSDWCGKQIPDDAFIVGMVAANKDMPPRKSFQEAMDAFKIFEQRKNAYMYLHTNLVSATGFPIMQYAKALGIEDKIFMTKDFVMRLKLKKENVPVLYNAFDLFLEPSTNEGFGVPIIEAQSCGIPTMCTNFTAMRDLVVDGETGYKIDVAYHRFTQLLSYVGVPSVQSIIDGMEKIYNVNRVKMGKKARKFIIDNYSLDLIWNTRWIPFLDKLEKEIYTQ